MKRGNEHMATVDPRSFAADLAPVLVTVMFQTITPVLVTVMFQTITPCSTLLLGRKIAEQSCVCM